MTSLEASSDTGRYPRPQNHAQHKLSRNLTRLLRHNMDAQGLSYRPDGFVSVSELFSIPRFRGLSLETLQQITRDDNKQRFALERIDGEWYIRANQGHTIKGIVPDQLLTRLNCETIPPVCVHGTTFEAWETIKKMGLCRMARNHIHFAQGLPGTSGVISGMRASSQVLIYLDVQEAMDLGCEFFMSQNGVILSPGLGSEGIIPPSCFSKVTAGISDRQLEWDKDLREMVAASS